MVRAQTDSGDGSHNGHVTNGHGAKRQKLSPDERVARNRRLIQQYGSQIVVPRSVECRLLLQMVYPLNKAIPRLRRDLGVRRTVAEVGTILEPIFEWAKLTTDWLRVSGGELILMAPTSGESSVDRERLVGNPRAHVIVPQTEEVRQVLEQAIRIDRVLVYIRMASMEQLREETRLQEAFELVRTLDLAVQSVCAAVGVKYFSPKGMQPRTTEGASASLPVGGHATV